MSEIRPGFNYENDKWHKGFLFAHFWRVIITTELAGLKTCEKEIGNKLQVSFQIICFIFKVALGKFYF